MICFFRTKMRTVKPMDAQGRPLPRMPPVIVRPVAVLLDLSLVDAGQLVAPGLLEVRLPTGDVLDLHYGYADTADEILRRDVKWLNDFRVWERIWL
jgi:hypothetical protein